MSDDLIQYIKDNHSNGLSWNPSGPPAPTAAAPPPPAGGAPPPPPPPAVVPPSGPASTDKQDSGAASALFSQINKAGNNISSGLRKVTDDMKTHKNPSLRQSSVVPSKPTPGAKPTAAPKPAAKKPPVFELQGGKKWIVDYQENNRNLVIDGQMQQTIYMYMCKGSTLQVKGKVNSITLDNCKKCAVVFDSVVSTCEFVNCQSVQCQVTGKVPTISIDKTDGCQVYLSKDSVTADIVSAKSSEMNVLVPKDDGDMTEFALPEQYKTKWNGKTFVTIPADN
ncbi:Adenylyl cyclase-associated protein 1 [Exaiptasia diaphana]|nr:Adenylyl cyclase-associated protein 1 [Exaiptasia diaphana]